MEHVLVKGQISNELFELTILFFKLLEAAQFGNSHSRELLLPTVERDLRHNKFAANLSNGGATLNLAQGKSNSIHACVNALFSKYPFRHLLVLSRQSFPDSWKQPFETFKMDQNFGKGSLLSTQHAANSTGVTT